MHDPEEGRQDLGRLDHEILIDNNLNFLKKLFFSTHKLFIFNT